MIGIINYGLGNVEAFLTVYKKLNIPALSLSSSEQFEEVDGVVLPGVGAFDEAMERLNNSGLIHSLNTFVCEQKKPVLGVCVGMQIMAKNSEEGSQDGLGWIPAQILKFKDRSLRLPHMGWNNVTPNSDQPLFKNIENPQFYFLHSYYFEGENALHTAAQSTYGFPFASAVQKENVLGTQFHPEKSHVWGTILLKNFAEFCN